MYRPLSIITLAFFAAAATTTVLTGCEHKETVQEKLLTLVSAQSVEEYIPKTDAHFSAVVQPSEQVDLAFKGSGYVQSIYKVRGGDGRLRPVQEGDFVRRGTVLARIEQGDYAARVNQQKAALDEVRQSQNRTRASLAEAAASLDQARLDYERTSRLFQSESVTKPDYEAAKSRLDIAEARVQEAKAQIGANGATENRTRASLQEVRLALRDCMLKAPIDGLVLKRNIEDGSLASQGAVAVTLADAATVKVAFGVPDVELRNLKLGQPLTVTAEACPGKAFHGTVSEIAPAADPRSRVFNVEVSLPNHDQQLRLGMITSLTVSHGQADKPRLTVPLTAVVRSTGNPDGYAVFVVEGESGKYIAREQPVKLGEAFGHLIAVVDGLKLGDRVVTNGSTRITNGQEIKVAEQNM